MRLKEYFSGKEDEEEKESRPWLKKTSDFTPESGRDKHLDSFIEAVKKEVLHGLKDNVKPKQKRTECH